MVEIIPSINAPDFEGVVEKIKKVEPYVEWCHLDVTDGVFSKHLTWHNPTELPRIQTKLNMEAHLMVENPEKYIGHWLISPIKRVIVHLEAVKDLDFIIQKGQEANIEIGLAIRPDTFWGKLELWADKINFFLILAVNPGPSGQKMAEDTFDKLNHLRKACPECQIEIDGGVSTKNTKELSQAGANLFVAGAAIFNSQDIEKSITELKTKGG